MRTSGAQFQLLVEFMERYGDLSKPTEGPQGRATSKKRWEDLVQILNAEPTGDKKTIEKWRKVWSDLKNNTKKKAARIHRAAQGTGGGPATNLQLSELEQRVLSIVGAQAATGIDMIPEIGLEDSFPEIQLPTHNNNNSLMNEREINTAQDDWNHSGPSGDPSYFPPAPVVPPVPEETGLLGGGDPPAVASDAPETSTPCPTRLPLPDPESPTPLPLTPRRRRRARVDPLSPSRRRTRTQTQSDLARQAFVRSDCEWRAFQQETERERNRIQERWQQILEGFFDNFFRLGNRIVDILEKNNNNEKH